MANFEKVSVETGARVELHDLLSLCSLPQEE